MFTYSLLVEEIVLLKIKSTKLFEICKHINQMKFLRHFALSISKSLLILLDMVGKTKLWVLDMVFINNGS